MIAESRLHTSVDIALKWMHVRDSVCRLFMFMDNTGTKYASRIHLLQGFLKAHMHQTGAQEREAVLALNEMVDEPYLKQQIVAAGYELLIGNDYTTKDNGEYDREMDDDIYD